MRLPRRVPWASIGELEQVCAWIYTDESDTNAQLRAVHRLAAWKAITSLPHALESTHAILTVLLQDSTSQAQPSSSLSLRQSYAAALIRLVNGLVDPLQLGAYARSITSIAAQLGLPDWLVELRHAATHEDLPSLEILREAAHEAMAWLLNNYFLPTLNPSTPARAQRVSLRPLSPLLKQYKALLKTTTRDASLAGRLRPEITRVLREVERWIAEAKVASPGETGEDADGEGDGRERWALGRLCDALIEKGALVPLSKKCGFSCCSGQCGIVDLVICRKRVLPSNTFSPSPSLLQIWTPLLTHLHILHPTLPSVLVFRILSHLTSGSSDRPSNDFGAETVSLVVDDGKLHISYDRCLAAWANWAVDTYADKATENEEGDDEEDEPALRRAGVVAKLIISLGPAGGEAVQDRKTALELLKALCKGDPTLEKAAAVVSALQKPPSSNTWQEADTQLMHSRLAALLTTVKPDAPDLSDRADADVEMEDGTKGAGLDNGALRGEAMGLPPGWRKITERDRWKHSPIGVFVACSGTPA
ncbi:Las1-domain-containing protein [Laetiporus sulphureus 93-53]|uniref:Las1-domain-containing protein n=1 Tax=Laetiporus sulphureus 93-53 TaxID=1314785 RepID=A0A165E5B1_9APHY|nr:Las1-domain-containing protein [Laetiporus sulphureus 93-53]KZT06264.1 Las1-domain-containing protein [Laetiporus sulphureus 93-53]